MDHKTEAFIKILKKYNINDPYELENILEKSIPAIDNVIQENENIKSEIILKGIITEQCPGAYFKIALNNNKIALGYTSDKIRKSKLRILVGDRVEVELLSYELKNENLYKCRIIRRLKN